MVLNKNHWSRPDLGASMEPPPYQYTSPAENRYNHMEYTQPHPSAPTGIFPDSGPTIITTVPTISSVLSSPVVIQTLFVTPTLGPTPALITCRVCNRLVVSRTKRRVKKRAHYCAGFLCGFGCWPCIWVPYWLRNWKRIEHYCPICEAYIGESKI